ncbi:MAG: hypothetical protein JJT76_13565 [Clostridiaceae bacterium]|nr:hypothetical protein [Clostridiaceae bacterium]
MKQYVSNLRGSSIAFFLIVCTTVALALCSTHVVVMNNYRATQSNAHAIKAQYLAESAIEVVLAQLMEETDKLINSYLNDLKEYKISYLKTLEGNQSEKYLPQNFENYLYIYLLTHIDEYNSEKENPFKDYQHIHSYKAKVSYKVKKGTLSLEGIGTYNNARKMIEAEVEMPYVKTIGEDSYGLPLIEIHSWNVIAYYNKVML